MFGACLPTRAAVQGGDVDLNFNPAISGSVAVVTVQADNKILLGGVFTSVNGTPRINIARLNPDGSLDTNFLNGLSGPNGTVRSMVVQDDNNVLIGGSFTFVNGTPATNIARLNPDGSLDSSFSPAVSTISCMALQPDGKIVIGGGWNAATGSLYYAHFRRLDPNGTRDTNFQSLVTSSCANPFSCTQPSVNSIAVQPDGKVVFGGLFTAVNGIPRYHLARVNSDDMPDVFPKGPGITYQGGFGTSASINAVALQPDGKVLIGGVFDYFNGVFRGGIARLHPDGALDTNFLAAVGGTDGNVNAIALQSDGKVLIGGIFSHVNGSIRRSIARLNSDGTLDTSFQDGMSGVSGGFISYVSGTAVQTNGKVLINGGFTTINGVVRNGFARLYGHEPRPLLSGGAILGNQYGFSLTGESNQVVIIEASADLTNWFALATNTLGTGALRFDDPAPPTSRQRFYRTRSP